MIRAYRSLSAALQRIDRIAAVLACVLLFALMMVVVADVSLRYLFNSPLTWSYEVISLFLLPGLFFLSVSHALGAHAHVAVDLVHNHVAARTRRRFELVSMLIATAVFAFIAWVGASQTLAQLLQGATPTSGLEVPTWLSTALLPIGFGLLAIRCALIAIGHLGTLLGGSEWIALPPLSGSQEPGR